MRAMRENVEGPNALARPTVTTGRCLSMTAKMNLRVLRAFPRRRVPLDLRVEATTCLHHAAAPNHSNRQERFQWLMTRPLLLFHFIKSRRRIRREPNALRPLGSERNQRRRLSPRQRQTLYRLIF